MNDDKIKEAGVLSSDRRKHKQKNSNHHMRKKKHFPIIYYMSSYGTGWFILSGFFVSTFVAFVILRLPHDIDTFLALFNVPKDQTHSKDHTKSFKSLDRVKWSSDLMKTLAKDRTPVLIDESPTQTQWKADTKWTLEYLSSQIKKPQNIHFRNPPVFIHYEPSTSLAHAFKKTFRTKRMTIERFLLHAPKSNTTGFYMNNVLEELSPSLLKDIEPTEPFEVYDQPSEVSTVVSEDKFKQKMMKLWIGRGQNVSANLHYDATHNVFHQVKGLKRFRLFPPSCWEFLSIHSALHPSHRQSMIDLSSSTSNILPQAIRNEMMEVTLKPGDTMYLPPFWFHQVTSFSQEKDQVAISVNIWTNSKEQNDFELNVLTNPMPYVEEFETKGWIYDANSNLFYLQKFLLMLNERVQVHSIINLLSQVYQKYTQQSNQGIKIWGFDEKQDTYPCGQLVYNTQQRLDRLQVYVDTLYDHSFARMSPPIAQLLYTNFVETLAAQFVQPETMFLFLKDCVYN